MSVRYRFAAIIGTILEHYDTALYSLLAPFLAPVFFADSDPITALILTYLILPVGIVTRPLGALVFGRIGDSFGRKQALVLSLLGMGIATSAIGFLPTFQQVGALAPCLLACARALQSFCAAGEATGGAIFVLEHTKQEKRSFISSLYDASTIGGIWIASVIISFFYNGENEQAWRPFFWYGGVCALFGLVMRVTLEDPPEYSQRKKITQESLWDVVVKNKKALSAIIKSAGFSYVTYSIPFVFIAGFAPLVTEISKQELIKTNSYLLLLDLCMLPLFGYIAMKIGKEKLMRIASLLALILAFPLFFLIEGATLSTLLFMRVVIVILGVAFAAPYHAWAMELVPVENRFRILLLGNALASQLIGAPACAVSLWCYQRTGSVISAALYLFIAAALAYSCVVKSKSKHLHKEELCALQLS